MFEHRKKPSEPRGDSRVCVACKKDQPLTEYYWHKGTPACPDGWPAGRCKTCMAHAQIAYRATRKAKYCEYAKRQRLKDATKTKRYDSIQNQRRKLRIKRALTVGSELVTREWFQSVVQQQNNQCPYCMCQMERAFHEHVVPVMRGGKHVRENVIAACGSCNSSKNDRLISEWRPWIDIPLYGLELASA